MLLIQVYSSHNPILFKAYDLDGQKVYPVYFSVYLLYEYKSANTDA